KESMRARARQWIEGTIWRQVVVEENAKVLIALLRLVNVMLVRPPFVRKEWGTKKMAKRGLPAIT
ncbi:hypothetical protein PMAYCL1PPCAC_06216, partial [Pristionchus mayeri]